MHISELFHLTYTTDYTTTEGGVDYAFKEENDTLFIFFQGSHQKVDWKNNFDFPKQPYKDMEIPYQVHRGFLKCWKEIEDIIIDKILTVENGGYKYNRIIVSGYSHGGALAQFCHECVWYHRPDIRDNCWSYGFEAPRIYGGYKVKQELRERWAHFILVRNHKDLVTHVPPRVFGFCDLGTVLHIGRDQYYQNRTDCKGPECIRSHYPDPVMDSLKEVDFEVVSKENLK
jgi:hypothetical protein